MVVPKDTDGYAGTLVDRPYAKPDLRFTDTSGRGFDLARDATAPVTIVFFGYTKCPDVCSTVLGQAAAALLRADPAVRERTQLVFITTDPARDSPKAIRTYLDRFNPDFVGLTAPMPVIEAAAKAFSVALTGTQKLPDGGYDVGHGAQLIGFGPGGTSTVVWLPDTSVGDLRADITKLSKSA